MTEITDFVLWYQKGDGTLQEFPVSKEMLVGSGKECNLVIADPVLAEKQFRIVVEGDQLTLVSLSAEKAVMLQNRNLVHDVPAQLLVDQVFKAGDYTFYVRVSEPASFMSLQQLNGENKPGQSPYPKQAEPAISQVKEEMLQKGRWKIFAGVFAGVFVLAMIGSWFLFIKPALQVTSTVAASSTSPATQEVATNITATEGENPTQAESTPSFAVGTQPSSSQEAALLTITPPGLGEVDFSTISISPDSININQLMDLQLSMESLLTMGLEITGENIGYVYRYAGLSENGKLKTIEFSYVKSEAEKVVDGVSYPDWGDEPIPVEINWKPSVAMIQDGKGSYPALVADTSYKTTEEAALFYTTGLYVFQDSGDKLYSLMYFDKDGQMIRTVVFNSTEGIVGQPREVTPGKGDQFIILLKEFVFDEKYEGTAEFAEASGVEIPAALQALMEQYGDQFVPVVYGKGKFVEYEGSTLTFGEQNITFSKTDGMPGDYVIGVAVEDMDGNFYITYVPVEVVEKYAP